MANISLQELESKINKSNSETNSDFRIEQKYGQYELWAGDSCLEAGSRNDVYQAWIKYRFQEKFRKASLVHEAAALKDEYIKLLEKGYTKDQLGKFMNEEKSKGPDKVQDVIPKNKTSAEEESVLQDDCTPSKTAAKSNPNCIMTDKALTGFEGSPKDLNAYLTKRLKKIAGDMLLNDKANSLTMWIAAKAKEVIESKASESADYGNLNEWVWEKMESSKKAHTASYQNPIIAEFDSLVAALASNSDLMTHNNIKTAAEVEKSVLPFFLKRAILAYAQAVAFDPNSQFLVEKLWSLAEYIFENKLWADAASVKQIYETLFKAVGYKHSYESRMSKMKTSNINDKLKVKGGTKNSSPAQKGFNPMLEGKKASNLAREAAALKDEYIKLLEKGYTKDQLNKFMQEEKSKGPDKVQDATPKNKTSADKEMDEIEASVESALHRDQTASKKKAVELSLEAENIIRTIPHGGQQNLARSILESAKYRAQIETLWNQKGGNVEKVKELIYQAWDAMHPSRTSSYKKAFDEGATGKQGSAYYDADGELSEEPYFLVSKTFETTTPESAEEGDFADSGFVFEDEHMSPAELAREIRNEGYIHWSSGHGKDASGWLSTEPQVEDYSTGEEVSYNLHFKRLDGSELTEEDYDFIRGLVK